MVTSYNEKDLVSFGNYVLSLVNRGMKLKNPKGEFNVSHADTENWKLLKTLEKKRGYVFQLRNTTHGINVEFENPESFDEFSELLKTKDEFIFNGLKINPKHNWEYRDTNTIGINESGWFITNTNIGEFEFSKPVCKGSMNLGNGCGNCEKCKLELRQK